MNQAVALLKALVCATEVALDGCRQWMAVLLFLGVQPCFAEEILEAVAQVVVMALEVAQLAVDPVQRKPPVSASSTDVAVPSVGIFVAEALAVDVQDLDHWLAVLTFWVSSVLF